MEKKLSYEDQVKIKNLLTAVKQDAFDLEDIKDSILKKVDQINEILNQQ